MSFCKPSKRTRRLATGTWTGCPLGCSRHGKLSVHRCGKETAGRRCGNVHCGPTAWDMTGLENATIGKSTQLAGVQTAGRGKRNHVFTRDEMKRILEAIVKKTDRRRDAKEVRGRPEKSELNRNIAIKSQGGRYRFSCGEMPLFLRHRRRKQNFWIVPPGGTRCIPLGCPGEVVSAEAAAGRVPCLRAGRRLLMNPQAVEAANTRCAKRGTCGGRRS